MNIYVFIIVLRIWIREYTSKDLHDLSLEP